MYTFFGQNEALQFFALLYQAKISIEPSWQLWPSAQFKKSSLKFGNFLRLYRKYGINLYLFA